MNIAVLSSEEIHNRLSQRTYSAQKSYLAMYSSWWGGVVKDPGLMVVPVDDHLVHRGDGVFEAMKVVQGKVYLLQQHLDRLVASAEKISLPLPCSIPEIREIILQTTALAKVREAVLRLYVSRGPGGFTANPYDSVGSQIYLVVTSLTVLSDEKYRVGVRVGRSEIVPKDPWFATIKTCNYLPNVLMKKESVDRQLDFTLGFDNRGYVTESSTENVILVDQNKNLIRPKLRQILRGTTMMRTFELAENLVAEGVLQSLQEKNLTDEDVQTASEVMMVGTTLDVLPVTEFEGKKIGAGVQGPVASRLLQLLREDMKEGPFATPVPSII